MKYCKKCGAEIPEGVNFCEKCGNSVGQAPKQKSGKKKWVIAISSGVIVLAVGIVGGLFATGVIGGKDNVVQTSTDTADIQETPSVSGEAVGNAEAEGQNGKESQKTDVADARDKAWEAFEAYKADIESEYKTVEQEYENAYEEDEDTTTASLEDYKRVHGYCMIYLDSDDYPELIVYDSYMTSLAKNYIWTYKSGTINKIEDFIYINSYQERQGYFYHLMHGESGMECTEAISQLNGISSTDLIQEEWSADGDDEAGEVFGKVYGDQKLAEKAELASGTWTDIAGFAGTIDEAFILLQRSGARDLFR